MNNNPVDKKIIEKIMGNKKYKELVGKRSRFAWILSAIMLVIYYSFILVVAFAPKTLGTKIFAGSVISIGIPVGVLIIVLSFVLTGIYVSRANSEFDALTHQIKEETK
ncbi:MAG: DUF485 domain-containing protein [Magnetococcales bacterium]|nr:DUF485 domain-containing protein [Magnetococcales bacterium]